MAKTCKYYLVIEGRVKVIVSTKEFNRECVLVDLIKVAEGMDFKISVVENHVHQFVLDSEKDTNFINFLLYENSR